MQVSETLNEGLKRQLKVTVPASDLEQRLMQRLSELSKRAQIRGFRPGKVPVHHLRRVYGKSVMAEVIQQELSDSSKQALAEKQLKPAYQPDIELTEDKQEVDSIMEGKADLAYTMSFEVVPAIEVKDFSGIEIERLIAEVGETEIDSSLERLKAHYKEFEPRPAGGKAETGDRLTISFVGRIDGEPFEGGTAEDVKVELGSGSFLPGFEDQLVGAEAGDEVKVSVTFPETYGVAALAGKPAAFDVEVAAVEAPKVTAVDDEFAKRLGYDSLEKLRDMVKGRIAEEYSKMSQMKLKRDVLDALDGLYSLDLPERLVEAEFQQIWTALTREMEREKQTFESEGTTEEEARREYRRIAERRVRLGLVLGTIGEQAGIAITEEELERALIERARQFPGQEREVYQFYRKNPNAMMELRGPIFEQKVVDHILAGAKVSEKKVTREELVKAVEDIEEHDHAHAHGHDHAHDHDHDHEHDHDHAHDHGGHEGEQAEAAGEDAGQRPSEA
jgi:trigger factor